MIAPVSDPQSLERVVRIVTPQREKCMYLYCNLMKYGLNEPKFQVYSEEPSGAVYACYYGDSLHVLIPDGNTDGTLDFIARKKPRTIFSSQKLPLKTYCEEKTGLYKLVEKCPVDPGDVRLLEREDIGLLVDFLYSNSETYRRTYDKENLRSQLQERLDTGYCRYFGLYDANTLVGCTFTKAELADMMIVGGVLVAPTHRKQGLGQRLCACLCAVAEKENKQAYCFIDDENLPSVRLHSSVGYRRVETVYKYILECT